MKKTYYIVFALAFTMLFTNGCALTPSINLTEEEEQKIVGYSADVLSGYVQDKNDKLVDTKEARELAARVEALKERNRIREEEGTTEESESEGDTENSEGSNGTQDIAEALGVTGFDISYSGCEICKTYPNDGTSDDYFNMEATTENELMVFHFEIRNVSDTDMVCDILDQDPILRMIMNGKDKKNALTTLLLDDMATLNEVIPAGQSKGVVVILEVPQGYEDSVETVSLYVKRGEEQSTIPIE